MLDDLDKTLKDLLEQHFKRNVEQRVTITFAAPDSKFPPTTVSLPAIDLFLYDIRENRELRSSEPVLERHADGRMTRRPAPLRVDCSYLVTAWATEGPDATAGEHGLLGEVLRILVRTPVIPVDMLPEALATDADTLPIVTLQPGRLQSLAELWQAAGGRPKAALHLTVTVPVWPKSVKEAEDVTLVTERIVKMRLDETVAP